MQFSKEDQEKLKNDKSEIYRKRTEETNREDVENLSKKGKWEYFKQYYLKGLICCHCGCGFINSRGDSGSDKESDDLPLYCGTKRYYQ